MNSSRIAIERRARAVAVGIALRITPAFTGSAQAAPPYTTSALEGLYIEINCGQLARLD
jgi:hypothetical protein